jgi:hypothetical protein
MLSSLQETYNGTTAPMTCYTIRSTRACNFMRALWFYSCQAQMPVPKAGIREDAVALQPLFFSVVPVPDRVDRSTESKKTLPYGLVSRHPSYVCRHLQLILEPNDTKSDMRSFEARTGQNHCQVFGPYVGFG